MEISKVSSRVSNEATESAPATPVASQYAETVQQRVDELNRWVEQIPRFAIPPAADATQRLSAAASVSPEFVVLTNVAVTNHSSLKREDAIPVADIRDLMEYALAYAPLADQLEAVAKFIRYSTTAARHAAGSEALTTYALASRLARRAATAQLAPHVADMRRALGRGRRPAAAQPAPNTPKTEAA